MIKVFTWSRFSHSALANHEGDILEAWEHNGIASELSPWANHTVETVIQVYEVESTSQQARITWNIGKELVGGGYDFISILGFLPITRRWWKDDPKKFFCSHYVAYCCRKGGVPLFSQETPLYKLSPGVLPWSPRLRWRTTVKNEDEWGEFIYKENLASYTGSQVLR
jgi:hypothetical protein